MLISISGLDHLTLYVCVVWSVGGNIGYITGEKTKRNACGRSETQFEIIFFDIYVFAWYFTAF